MGRSSQSKHCMCIFKKKTTLTQFLSHKISCLYIFQDLCTLRTHLELRATSVSPTSMEPWCHLLLSSTSSWKACSTQRLKSALERSDIVLIHMDRSSAVNFPWRKTIFVKFYIPINRTVFSHLLSKWGFSILSNSSNCSEILKIPIIS